MTRQELKAAIRNGDPTPGVDQALFESAWAECVTEDYPGSRIATLVESRSSSTGLPTGVHDRVADMLSASKARRQPVRQLQESSSPRSDLKDDRLNHLPHDHDTDARILRDAAERFKARTDEDAIKARIHNRDGEPKPFRFVPARTLVEAMVEADRLPKGIHAIVANRMSR